MKFLKKIFRNFLKFFSPNEIGASKKKLSFSIGNGTANNSFVTDTTVEETVSSTDEHILRPKTTTILSFVDKFGGVCYNKTARNIAWPNTLEGYTATVPCPGSSYSNNQ